jgi:hypothetical protein
MYSQGERDDFFDETAIPRLYLLRNGQLCQLNTLMILRGLEEDEVYEIIFTQRQTPTPPSTGTKIDVRNCVAIKKNLVQAYLHSTTVQYIHDADTHPNLPVGGGGGGITG